VLLAPREVHELAVARQAEHLRVAVGEVGVALAELGDLGRAHEGEVERPREHHEPLAGVARSVISWKCLPASSETVAGRRKEGNLLPTVSMDRSLLDELDLVSEVGFV
jgi:hypothetical protein